MRLIDADALPVTTLTDGGYWTKDVVYKSDVDAAPTVDAVEVVRMPVKGYEGYYEVDQFGRVYGCDRVVRVEDNDREYDKPIKGKQLKQTTHSAGYKVVGLTKDGTTKTTFVHRIVAEAFIPNPDNLPMVNHKDEDKTNNFVENLEWCTAAYNNTYGSKTERQAAKIRGRVSEKRVPVIQRELDGTFVDWHASVTEAANRVKSRPQAISAVCNGKRTSHKGFRWEFDGERKSGTQPQKEATK